MADLSTKNYPKKTPEPPRSNIPKEWHQLLSKHWPDAIMVTLSWRMGPNQREEDLLKEVAVRVEVDGKAAEPTCTPITLSTELAEDARAHCEGGPVAAFYGIAVYGFDKKKGELVCLGASWRRVSVGNQGGLSAGTEEMLVLIGQQRSALQECRASEQALASQIVNMSTGVVGVIASVTEVVKALPTTMQQLFDKMQEVNEKHSETVQGFYEHQSGESTKRHGFEALITFGLAAMQYQLARNAQDKNQPWAFDPDTIRNAGAATEDGTVMEKIMEDLAITEDQRPALVEILGEDVVSDLEGLTEMDGDPEEILAAVRAIWPHVAGHAAQLLPLLNEAQTRALMLLRSLAGL